jgi:hypothetical protein
MKKFMFSAIAMIAFVGSSMAAAVNSDIAFFNKEVAQDECVNKAYAYMEIRDPEGKLDAVTYHNIYQAFLQGCFEGSGRTTVSGPIGADIQQ